MENEELEEHEELRKFSPDHAKVSKLGLSWVFLYKAGNG